MRKTKALMFGLFLLACLSACFQASAAKSFYPMVELAFLNDSARVRLWEFGDTAAFFLPFSAKQSGLTLYFEEGLIVSIDEERRESGETLALAAGKKHTIRYGGVNRSLRVMYGGEIPTLFLTTNSGTGDFIHAKNGNKEPGAALILSPDGDTLLNAPLSAVRARGNSSFAQPKKPYQIKFEEATGLFSMGADKKWILLANHKDLSLARNHIVFGAARALGEQYGARGQWTELYLNGCYVGLYQLTEKVEIGKNRIDVRELQKETEKINATPLEQSVRYGENGPVAGSSKGFLIENNPADITGGYLLELEKSYHYDEEPAGFVTARGQCVVIKSPEYPSKEQVTYIKAYMQAFENAVFSESGTDPETGLNYTEMVDLDSMAREYLLEEVFKNFDANQSSQFIVKPSDKDGEAAFFGPAWDFDLSMGDFAPAPKASVISPKGLYAASGAAYSWLPALYKQQAFYERVIVMYYERLAPYLNELLEHSLDALYTKLAPSAAMNFTRWPILKSSQKSVDTGDTYEENFSFLKKWLRDRMTYLDSVWQADYLKLQSCQ